MNTDQNAIERILNLKVMYKEKSLNDISEQRDRLKIMNKINIINNKTLKNRADLINIAASNSRIIRGFSIFSKDRNKKQ